MQQKYDSEIRLDRFGHPDIDFYTREARRLQAEAFLALFHNISHWLRTKLSHRHGLPMRSAH